MTALLIVTGLILFTVTAFMRREWAIVFILAALPSYLIRFKILNIPATFLEVCILILALAWLIDWSRRHRGIPTAVKALIQAIGKPFGLLFMLWLIIGLIACFWSPDRLAGLGLWRAYFAEPIMFIIVVQTTLRDLHGIRSILGGLGLGALVVGAVSALQAMHLMASPEPWASEWPPRLSSVFDYPNAVALLLAPLAALFIGLLVTRTDRRSRHERIFLWVVVLISLFSSALTVSFGAALGLAIALFVYLLFTHKRRVILLIGAAAMLALLLIPQTRTEIGAFSTIKGTSGDVRYRLWTGTVRMLEAHPITGAGLAGFPTMFDQYRDADQVELLLYPHNVFLNFWAELGLLGLWLFLVFLIRFFINTVRTYRASAGFLRGLCLGLILGMTTLLGHGLVDVPYFKNDLAILFLTFIVLGELVVRNSGKQQTLLPVVNEQDEIIGEASRSEIHEKGLLHREIHVYFYTPDNKIIFQRRSAAKDTFPGLLEATVGGHVEAGETYAQAAIKESEEETGAHIKLNELQAIEKVKRNNHDHQTGTTNNVYWMMFSYLYRGEVKKLHIEEGKASGFESFTITELRNLSDEARHRFIPLFLSAEWLQLYDRIINNETGQNPEKAL